MIEATGEIKTLEISVSKDSYLRSPTNKRLHSELTRAKITRFLS
jgi:hypothetical protein